MPCGDKITQYQLCGISNGILSDHSQREAPNITIPVFPCLPLARRTMIANVCQVNVRFKNGFEKGR
jgi:hypothetical protein